MSIFDNDPKDFILISHVPPLVQENGEKIDPRAEQYIHGGEVCEFNEYLRMALKKYIKRDRYFVSDTNA